jgi:hypothetical protein
MTTRPEDIVLDDEDRKALAEIGSRQQAVQTWLQTIAQQGEARLAQLHDESKKAWVAIADKYQIDLSSVDYRLSDDGERLEAFRVHFK